MCMYISIYETTAIKGKEAMISRGIKVENIWYMKGVGGNKGKRKDDVIMF